MQRISGRHLILDVYVRDAHALEPGWLCSLCDLLVAELGMEYLQRPAATRVPERPDRLSGDEDEGGWSVICQITTSHIAIHGWPLRRAVMMDVFSCRDFDADRARDIVWDQLGLVEARVQVVSRGLGA